MKITQDDFINYELIQVAAMVMRIYMMSNYGNLVYLDEVEWKNPDSHSDTEYVGSLCVAMQRRRVYGEGWEFLKPLEDAGTIVLNNQFQLKSATLQKEIREKLRREYAGRGIRGNE